jgi:glycosyltransferase involved in cell wall biosynthesis
MRALQTVELLAARHRVTLLAPEPPPGAPQQTPPPRDLPYDLQLYPSPGGLRPWAGLPVRLLCAWVRGLPLQTAFFPHGPLGDAVGRLAPEHDLAVLQTVRLAGVVDRLGATPFVVDLIDSLALSFARRARREPWLSPLWRVESRRLAAAEDRLVVASRGAVVVAERDRDAMIERMGERAGRVRVVPVAVEGAEGVAGDSRQVDDQPVGPPVLVVTGNLGYFPTVEGLRWFLDEVWPTLSRRRPEVSLCLAGSRLPKALARRARELSVDLVDRPSDDELAAILAGATLALAPLRAGAGQPMKVIEAWAAGLPVVATGWAARGTTGVPGRELVVPADDASRDSWVATIEELLDDAGRRRALAVAARKRLSADYSRAGVARAWADLVDGSLS